MLPFVLCLLVPSFDDLPAGAIARLGTSRLRHGGVIRALAFSPDGKTLASASHDRTASLWEVVSGRELLRLRGHESDSTCLAWLPGGRLATGSADGFLRVWFVEGKSAGKLARASLISNDGILCLALSPDGKTLAVGCDDGAVHLVDPASGKAGAKWEHDRAVASLAWTPDGKTLAVGTGGKYSIVLRDTKGRSLRSFGAATPTALAFSPDGKSLAAWEPGDTVRVWNAATGAEAKSWRTREGADARGAAALCYQVAWIDGGKAILAGDSMGQISAWNPVTGKPLFHLDAHQGRLTALASSSHGTIATAGADHCIRLWDRKKRKPLIADVLPVGPIRALSASATGKNLAVLTFAGDVLQWDRKGKAVPLAGEKAARAAILSPEGESVVILNRDGKVARRAGGKARVLPMPLADELTLSADGKRLASLRRAGSWWLHDADGKALHKLPGSESSHRVVLSADGKLAASVGGAAAVPIWNGETGKLRRTLRGHRGGTMAGAFSPDGRMLATGGRDRMLRFWDVDSGRERGSPRGQTAWVTAVAVSGDGKLVACGMADGMVQVRSARSGMLLADRAGHRGPITALVFLDGKGLASAGEDTSVLIWDVSGASKPAAGPRKLTAEEKALLWKRMMELDPALVSLAQEKLALAGDASLDVIRRDVKPVDAKRAARLMKELVSDDFDVRKRAAEALRARAYEAMLRQALRGRPPLDLVKRIEKTLAEMAYLPQGEEMRCLRAVELLEMIGSSAARKLLEELASGAPHAELTQRSQAALARIGKK